MSKKAKETKKAAEVVEVAEFKEIKGVSFLARFFIIVKPLLFFVVAALLLATVYHLVYARKIIPGVVIVNVKVGGLGFDSAVALLDEQEKAINKTLILSYGDKKFEIKGEDIGLIYDSEVTVTRAFEVGRTGNIFSDSKEKLVGLLKPLWLPFSYVFDDEALHLKLAGIKGELNVDTKDAGFVLQANKLVKTPSVEGARVDAQNLYEQVVGSFDKMDFSEKTIVLERTTPILALKDLETLPTQMNSVVFNPLQITYGKKIWKLTPQQILDLIQIKKDGNNVALGVNKSNLETYISSIAQEIIELPRGKVESLDGNKVVGFTIVKSGKELDSKKFSEDFKNAFLSSKPLVKISTIDVQTSDSPSKYGIVALLGEGKSRFVGSIRARVKNLTLAAERTSGVLVAPGATYSFNKSVGEISAANGYDSAYIINNGRTVLGEGGGVCQTSTTLFRAILNAGLPITMRYPHAYRVGYYEQDSPVGFDASVFQPSLDLQFKNDTSNYILIQSYADIDTYSLAFRIYGTPDGRTVEITKPLVTNISSAPAPLYQDDPTLALGVVKQVDFAANGATVSFTRTVKDSNGNIIHKDDFSSRYQPWRAVFLVGKK